MKNKLTLFSLFLSLVIYSQVEADVFVNIHDVSISEMNSLTPESGALIYNTSDHSLYVFNGTIWEKHKSDVTETNITIDSSTTNSVIISGEGTDMTPYIFSNTKATLTDNLDGTFTFSNGIDIDQDIFRNYVLYNNLTDISLAFSFRKMEINYNGPLVKLRRVSDNAEQDFYSVSELIDIDAINIWRSGANVNVVIWYDQSG